MEISPPPALLERVMADVHGPHQLEDASITKRAKQARNRPRLNATELVAQLDAYVNQRTYQVIDSRADTPLRKAEKLGRVNELILLAEWVRDQASVCVGYRVAGALDESGRVRETIAEGT